MKSFSQAGQDLFVYNILERKNDGTYLDIGCGNATDIFTGTNNGSNSLLLSTLGWKGIGFDVQENLKNIWEHIKDDKIYIENIISTDWNKIINENKILQNGIIDYLSFDIDDSTMDGIKNFPFDKLKFRVITIEHDSYRVGNKLKFELRKILINAGYELLCSDVMVQIDGYNEPWIYEDWWVNMNLVNKELAILFKCDKELGKNIALKGDNYLNDKLNKKFKINISIGEAVDRLSILNIKKILIKDETKLNDINNELKEYDSLISYIKNNCINEYKDIYITNKHIWYLSDILRNNQGDDNYKNALINVHSYNDKRFTIKNKINSKLNSSLKEHKSYQKLNVVEDNSNYNIINYTGSGALGDFFNTLYIIKNIYNNTGKKGILYMTNFEKFINNDIKNSYYELIDIVLGQEYIEDFILEPLENIHEFRNKYNFDFVDLNSYRCAYLLFKDNWINIFTDHFKLNIVKPIPWLKITGKFDKFKDKILIHSKNNTTEILLNCINKNKCIFISCDKKEYDRFLHKELLEDYYICEDLNEILYAINSCKFFIGSQSLPLACAVAMGVNCLGILIDDTIDHIHYVGVESYHKNFYWACGNNISSNFNSITNFINF